MPRHTLSLSEDACQALRAAKHAGESFSDGARRLTRRGSLTELVGIMDKRAAEAIANAISKNRAERRRRTPDGPQAP